MNGSANADVDDYDGHQVFRVVHFKTNFHFDENKKKYKYTHT